MFRAPSRYARPPRRTTRAAALAVALCAAAVLAGCSGSRSSGSPADPNAFRFTSATPLGSVIPAAQRKPAEAVSGTSLTGATVSLQQDRGHVTVLNFWGSWCGPCRTETPQVDLFYRAAKAQGVRVIGVDTKDFVKGNATSFVAENHISFPSLYDPEARVALALGNLPVAGLPFTVLVDKQGRIAAVYISIVTPKDLQRATGQLLTGQ